MSKPGESRSGVSSPRMKIPRARRLECEWTRKRTEDSEIVKGRKANMSTGR